LILANPFLFVLTVYVLYFFPVNTFILTLTFESSLPEKNTIHILLRQTRKD
jgi:hypothetical protein